MPSVETIPKTAKGAFFEKTGGEVTIQDYKVVQPSELQPGQALVKLEYSGVCHTDLHALLGDWPLDNKLPQGFESLCAQAKLHGFTHDGTFQQYAVSYTNHLTRIPKGLGLHEAAPVLCAGVTVYKAIKQSGVRCGQWIALPGAGGGLGHLAIQYAQAQGLRVVAIDTGEEKKKLCSKLGAEVWIDFKETEDIIMAIKAAVPDGLGPHAAIVTAAQASGYEQALEYIRPGGVVVAVGLPPGAVIKSEVFTHVLYEKKLIGSYVGNRQDADEAIQLAAMGKVRCEFVIKELKDLPQIYDDMHTGKMVGRTVLKLH